MGTFHKLSPKHLDRYVREFAGKHNLREEDTIDIMQHVAAGLIGRRLMYRQLIADNGLDSGARASPSSSSSKSHSSWLWSSSSDILIPDGKKPDPTPASCPPTLSRGPVGGVIAITGGILPPERSAVKALVSQGVCHGPPHRRRADVHPRAVRWVGLRRLTRRAPAAPPAGARSCYCRSAPKAAVMSVRSRLPLTYSWSSPRNRPCMVPIASLA